MHIGAPACGMNAAVRAAVRSANYKGYHMLGINDGVDGFVAGKIKEMGIQLLFHLLNNVFV